MGKINGQAIAKANVKKDQRVKIWLVVPDARDLLLFGYFVFIEVGAVDRVEVEGFGGIVAVVLERGGLVECHCRARERISYREELAARAHTGCGLARGILLDHGGFVK